MLCMYSDCSYYKLCSIFKFCFSLLFTSFYLQQKQDIFSEFSHSLTLTPTHRQTKSHCCETQTSTPTKEVQIKKNRPLSKSIKEKNSNLETENPKSFGNGTQEVTDNTEKVNKVTCGCCILSNGRESNNDLEFLYAFVSINVKDNVLPQSFLKGELIFSI